MIPSLINTGQGLTLNPIRQYVKGVIVVPASAQIPVATAAQSGVVVGRSAPVIVESGTDCCTEIFSFMGDQDSSVAAAVSARFACEIIETFRGQRRLMNREILCDHLFGSPQNPFFLSESLFLEQKQTLAFNFINRSTAGAASFRFALEGRKFQNVNLTHRLLQQEIELQRRWKDVLMPFWLTTDAAVSIAASSNAIAFATTTQDQWFMITGAMASAITTGVAGDTQEYFTAKLFDPRTDRPLQNQPVSMNCGFGTASFPYVFPTPWLIEPQSQIKIELSNLITDQATEVFITFCGVSMYSHKTPDLMNNIYKTRPLSPQIWNR